MRDSVASALFTPVQADLLECFFSAPDAQFSVAELIRHVDRGSGAVQRQLASLHAADILTLHKVGNQRRFQANRRSPIFPELLSLVAKSVGVVGKLRARLLPLADQIEFAFVFGSFAAGSAGSNSDIDLAVVTKRGAALDHATLFDLLAPLDRELKRPVEPMLLPLPDWKRRRKDAESFVSRIAGAEKLMVIGDPDDAD